MGFELQWETLLHYIMLLLPVNPRCCCAFLNPGTLDGLKHRSIIMDIRL